jgi:hypothetical protein
MQPTTLRAALDAALHAQSWREFLPLRDMAIASLKAYGEALRQADRAAGRRTRHTQATYTVSDVHMVRRQLTASGVEDTELWRADAPITLTGWESVAHGLADWCVAHGVDVDQQEFAAAMLWRRNSVTREGAAVCRVRLPSADGELWLVATVSKEESR